MIDLFYEYTSDDLMLQGTYFDSGKKDCCIVFIHGQAQTIADNKFAYIWGKYLSSNGISFLYGHNRGYAYMNCMSKQNGELAFNGSTFENFDDCVKDIEVWCNKVKTLGYKKVILMGHSLGCNKVLHYLNNTKEKFDGVIFASTPDMVGITKQTEKNYKNLVEEARKNIENGNPRKLLSKLIGDTDYSSSINFIKNYTEESYIDNFPIERNPKIFKELSKVYIPILTFAGSEEYPTFLKQDILKEKAISCPNFTNKIIKGSNHFYYRHELEIAEIILNWVKEMEK